MAPIRQEREEHIGEGESKGIFYNELEEFARQKIGEQGRDLLEQEVTEWLEKAPFWPLAKAVKED